MHSWLASLFVEVRGFGHHSTCFQACSYGTYRPEGFVDLKLMQDTEGEVDGGVLQPRWFEILSLVGFIMNSAVPDRPG